MSADGDHFLPSREAGLDLRRCLCRRDTRIQVAHHSHVFVSIIMAMEHEGALECTESHQKFDDAIACQGGCVVLKGARRWWRATVEADQLM